jgi:hypothetical protein
MDPFAGCWRKLWGPNLVGYIQIEKCAVFPCLPDAYPASFAQSYESQKCLKKYGAPDTIRTCDLCLRRAAHHHQQQQWAARTRSEIYSWRKIEEAKSGCADFLLKLLKRLALPRGIEPLFQP